MRLIDLGNRRMKKIIAIVMCLFLMVCMLCGCVGVSENARQETDNANITIYVDKETGVNYYIFSDYYASGYKGGMTVRVNADGTPYVSEVK